MSRGTGEGPGSTGCLRRRWDSGTFPITSASEVSLDTDGARCASGAMSGKRSGRAAHHADPRYVKLSAIIRAAARATPDAVCWRCGKRLAEHRTRNGKPDVWQAGHTRQGSTSWEPWLFVDRVPPDGDWLAPEARSCNAGDGARIRNALSATGYDWP